MGFVNGENQDEALTGIPAASTLASTSSRLVPTRSRSRRGLYPPELHLHVQTWNADRDTSSPGRRECRCNSDLRLFDCSHTAIDRRVRQRRVGGDQRCDRYSGVRPRPRVAPWDLSVRRAWDVQVHELFLHVQCREWALHVTPAQLTVAANDINRLMVSTILKSTYTISGFVNGETAFTGGSVRRAAPFDSRRQRQPRGSLSDHCSTRTLEAANYEFLIPSGPAPHGESGKADRRQMTSAGLSARPIQSLGWELVREDAPQTPVSTADPDPLPRGPPAVHSGRHHEQGGGLRDHVSRAR